MRLSARSIKKMILLLAFVFLRVSFFAEEMTLYNQDYRMRIQYNDIAYSGDAVFMRLEISPASVALKKDLKPKAKLTLFIDGKSSRKSDFYQIPTTNKDLPSSSITMLTGIPLSTWWTNESSYYLELSYSVDGKNSEVQKLPFVLMNKTFVSETIELDDRNTSIKTDNSKQRMDQIQNLNEILATINDDAVYQTTKYLKPVNSNYRTSFLETAGFMHIQAVDRQHPFITALTSVLRRETMFLPVPEVGWPLQAGAIQRGGASS